jgi:hypothetical protein
MREVIMFHVSTINIYGEKDKVWRAVLALRMTTV